MGISTVPVLIIMMLIMSGRELDVNGTEQREHHGQHPDVEHAGEQRTAEGAGDDARGHADAIASANWHASAALAATAIEEALFLDMGSTTTDIVPLAGGTARARGFTDRQRLVEGELVYQGYTRTALMAVENRVPFAGRSIPVMNEFFATMADVQRIVGTLDEMDSM